MSSFIFFYFFFGGMAKTPEYQSFCIVGSE